MDQQFGSSILRDAAEHGYLTACPAGKNDPAEFDFELGKDFRARMEACHPTFCKVLVRYDSEAKKAAKTRQSSQLARLSDYLHRNSRSLFLLELLVDLLQAFIFTTLTATYIAGSLEAAH